MTDRTIEGAHDTGAIPAYSPEEQTCRLTTFGRRDGHAHDDVLRYAMRGDTMYLLSDAGGESEWVQNLIRNPEISVGVDNETFSGMGRVVTNPEEDRLARELLDAAYEGWHEGQPLSRWASSALPVAVDRTPHVR